MNNIYVIIFISLTILSCNVPQNDNENYIKQAIPIDSELIIKFYDIKKINDKISSFDWWQELQTISFLQEYLQKLSQLSKSFELNRILHNRIIYLSAISSLDEKVDILLTSSISELEQINNIKLLQTQNNQKRLYEDVTIYNVKIKNAEKLHSDVFWAIYNNVFLLSFSNIMIEKGIRQLKSNMNIFSSEEIKTLDQNLPKYSDLNILIKTNFLARLINKTNLFLNSRSWSCFDVELEKNHILLNGVTNRDNIQYLKKNKYSDAKKSNIENIIPRHIKGFYKYQIDDKSDINEVLNILLDGPHQNIYHISKNSCQPTEINIAYDNTDFEKFDYILFKSDNPSGCENYLEYYDNKDELLSKEHNYNIKQLETNQIADGNWIKEITHDWNNIYYNTYQEYIIMSHSQKKLKSLLNNIKSSQTIGQSIALKTINNQLGNRSHTSFYLNLTQANKDWQKVFNSVVSKNIASENYFFNSLMLLYENDDFTNTTVWNFNLDYETNYKPQIVKNHYTNDWEIITQDIENNIYLIDANGKRIWSKNIGNAIIGDIHQIDSYNNNKLQYLFNTKDSIYLIDRNGQYVPPFPKKGKKSMSLPLALFDYDHNETYRILVPMENELMMYSKRGEIISGWEFLTTKSKITNTPEHYQIFGKDYIIVSEENGTVHLLNRKGQHRIDVKNKIHRSNSNINLVRGNTIHNSKFIIKNRKGTIISLNINGEIDTLNIQNLDTNDIYEKNNKYTIITKGGLLNFSSKKNKFKYHFQANQISNIDVFTNNESIFIAVRNQSENLIYLLNENGSAHKSPFFGTTEFSIKSLNKDDQMNLIVGSHEGLIYNYLINLNSFN